MKCLSCNKNKPIDYEEIGEGKYCQSCLDRETMLWQKEAGFNEVE